jgi:hypothetical protein
MRRGLPHRLGWLVVALAATTALLYTVRATLVTPRGLRAAYFSTCVPSGTPAISAVDPIPASAAMARRWRGIPPEEFSAQFTGFITTWRPGTYTFALTSDDEATLSIDGSEVIAITGRHGAATQSASIPLDTGAHRVTIDYVQFGGDFVLNVAWARDGGGLRPVPSWVLTPRRVRLQSILLGRAADLAVTITLALTLLAGGAWVWRRTAPSLRRAFNEEQEHARGVVAGDLDAPTTARAKAAALLLFAALAIVHTWPLATNPGHLTRNDNADTMLNEWIVAWVAHQLPRDPIHLFDANIFYPERDTLAYSESMITQGLMGAPLAWLGASPVLVYNLLVIAGFALTGWAMALVIARWTGSWVAALVAGCVYGFNAHTLTRIPHLQALHVEFLPLALLALDRLLRDARVRDALAVAGWFVLQALASIHLFVFGAFALAASTVVRAGAFRGGGVRRLAPLLAVAAAAALIVLLPFLLPYSRASAAHGFSRSIEVVAGHAATWQDYLSTPARLHYPLWSHHFFFGTALFPGALGLLLAAAAFVRGTAVTNPRARMFVAIAVTGVALSFGPELPGYALLYQLLPPLRAIRAVVRFGYLAILGVAGLSGFGGFSLRRLMPGGWWAAVSVALVAVAALEPFAAPLGLRPFDRSPAIYSTVADIPDAVVVEIPFADGRGAASHAEYMLNSTAHWRPLLNGYSGFQPPGFYEDAKALRGFPDAASIELLRTQQVTHIFVHTDRLDAERAAAVRANHALRLVATDGPIELYALDL